MSDSLVVPLLAGNSQSFGNPKVTHNYTHMSVGVGITAIILLIYLSLHDMVNEHALVSIIIFNFLFVFLLFPLEGPLLRKIYLLIAGNIVGLVWYFIESCFGAASVFYLGTATLETIIVIIGPVIDLVWLVSVWSLSLSLLASAKKRNEGDEENI